MSTEMKVVVFKIGNEDYGFDIQKVVSIEKMQSITPMPMAHQYIRGMMDLRGEIVPVIDLREALLKKETIDREQTRIIATKLGDQSVGVIVDEATDVIDIQTSQIQQPQLIGQANTSFLQGIVKLENRVLVLLDVEELLENFQLLDELEELTARHSH